jgi:hypothetical protein
MAWKNRDWDDYVRGQPGTWWGEEKIRQRNQGKIIEPHFEGGPRLRRKSEFSKFLALVGFLSVTWYGYTQLNMEPLQTLIVGGLAGFIAGLFPNLTGAVVVLYLIARFAS